MNKTRITTVGLAGLLILLLTGTAATGRAASVALDWWVCSGGGSPATATTVSLNGSLGQTAIGLSAGGNVSLSAGYWRAGDPAGGSESQSIYLPLVLKGG